MTLFFYRFRCVFFLVFCFWRTFDCHVFVFFSFIYEVCSSCFYSSTLFPFLFLSIVPVIPLFLMSSCVIVFRILFDTVTFPGINGFPFPRFPPLLFGGSFLFFLLRCFVVASFCFSPHLQAEFLLRVFVAGTSAFPLDLSHAPALHLLI